MTDNLVIDVKNLTKSFDGRVVVNGLDMQVKKGEVFGFLGPNGSGKTTTIRMLCGLLTPDSGEGRCLGYDILTQSDMIKQNVGYMTQKFSFYTDLSVEENLYFIARVYNIDEPHNHVEKILEQMGLADRRGQLTGELSGGWKQRVALAACLLHDPKLLLLDEPTAGVDPLARREFWDNIHHLSEQGITTFVSTHYMDEAERCTRLAYLAHGELLVTGGVNDVIKATNLSGWEISGNVTTKLLKTVQGMPGVIQAAFFGNRIHICGFDKAMIESSLDALSTIAHSTATSRGLSAESSEFASTLDPADKPRDVDVFSYYPIEVSLEDAFISLVKTSKGELG